MREIKVELNDGRYAVVRNFVRNRDARKVQKVVLAGKEFSSKDAEKFDGEFSVAVSNMLDYQDACVECLLLDYNAERETPFEALMDSEYLEDLDKLREVCGGVFDKAQKAVKK